MSDYLPEAYVRFREHYADVARSLDALVKATEEAGSLDARAQRLVKLGIAIGAAGRGCRPLQRPQGAGCWRHRRRDPPDGDARHNHSRLPGRIAASTWIEEVLAAG